MTPERWQAVKELFHSALERDPDERQAYVAERCANDPELKQELESLLAQHERAQGFLSRPALVDTLALEADQRHASLAGQLLLHYELQELLGKGGMGEVYAARDLRLGRRVALKLLPPRFAPDPERVQRFQREAQAGSIINHPNIVTVHEIGQLEDIYFIVTELVDGQTLEARLADGPLDCDQLLAIASQLADALDEAHGAGIVHRDIKPSNLMLTRRGQLKVLDLGLAKMIGDEPKAHGLVAWHGTDTLSGMLMGTAPYMSPEQSRGADVDHRSDLFSTGVVMYQMATGTLPFAGASLAAVLEEVRHREPTPVSQHNPAIPAELERIIGTCLHKQPAERYQSARALLQDLQALIHERQTRPNAALRAAEPRRPRRWLGAPPFVLVILVVFLVLGGGILAGLAGVRAFAPRTTRSDSALLPAALRQPMFTQLTYQAGEELFPSLAPDGHWFVYASRVAGNWDIYRRDVSGGEIINLTASSTQDDSQPAVSPDGEHIAFHSERDGGGIFIMTASGTDVRRISATGANPAWSPDGREIAYSTGTITFPHSRRPGEIWAVDIASGEQRLVAKADAVQPSYSPHGYRIAYWGLHEGSGQRDIWTIAATHDAGAAHQAVPVPVTDDEFLDWNPVWSPDGTRLYFASNRGGSMNLWSVAIDERTGAVAGPPVPVTIPSAYVAHIAFSANGERMVYAQVVSSSNLQRIGFDPIREQVTTAPRFITLGSMRISSHDLSPDGAWLVVTAVDGSNREGLYLISVEGAYWRRLTDGAHHDRTPRWSPDGQRIAFYSDRSGKYEIWTVDKDGSRLTQVTHTTGGVVYYPIWSPDGSRLLYQHRGVGNFLLAIDQPWTEQTPERLPQDGIEVFTPWAWSPDGQKLVGGLRRRGSELRSLATYQFATGQYEELTDVGLEPAIWLDDSRRLLFRSQGTLYLLDSADKELRELISVAPDTIDSITLSPDNQTIYFNRTTLQADIWLASPDPSSRDVHEVANAE